MRYCNWIWHFKAASGCPLMTRKQCSGMQCVKREENRAKAAEEQRNVGNRSETVREQVSDVSIPGSSLLPLASSLRHRSASSFNVTLRDDESSGGWVYRRTCRSCSQLPCQLSFFLYLVVFLRHQRQTSDWRNLLGRNGNLDFAEQSLCSLTAGWSGVNGAAFWSCSSTRSCTEIEFRGPFAAMLVSDQKPTANRNANTAAASKSMRIIHTSNCLFEFLTLQFAFLTRKIF